MSIANLYGKTPNTLAAINPALASKEYIPGGIMLSSPIFAPAAGFNASEVAGEDGRKVKLYYTKIGNQVTITCRMYLVWPMWVQRPSTKKDQSWNASHTKYLQEIYH